MVLFLEQNLEAYLKIEVGIYLCLHFMQFIINSILHIFYQWLDNFKLNLLFFRWLYRSHGRFNFVSIELSSFDFKSKAQRRTKVGDLEEKVFILSE